MAKKAKRPIGPLELLISGTLCLFASLCLFSYLSLFAALGLTYRRLAICCNGGLFGFAVIMLTRFVMMMRLRSAALRSLPGPTYGLLGLFKALASKDPHRWSALWANEFGPIVKVRIFVFHMVLITDPTLAMHVLYSPHFDKFGFAYSFLDPLLNGSSILTGPTDNHWKQVRKGIAPAFSTAHMRDAVQLVVSKTDMLVEYLKACSSTIPQNIDKLLLREAMDVIGEFGFQKGMQALDELKDPSIEEKKLSDVDVLLGATHEIERRLRGPQSLIEIWDPQLWFGAYLLKRYRVASLLEHVKHSKLRSNSFADLLLKTTHHQRGDLLSDKERTPEIAALFFAGIDTTGHTETWLMYMMTQNPDVEAKVVAELDRLELLVTPERPSPRKLTYADLAKLEYLQAVIKEVLRIYPPVGIGQIREATADVSLAGKLAIPRGVLVWVSHYAMHNTNHNWENPEKFDPDRWLSAGTEYAQSFPLGKEWYEGLNLGGWDPTASAGSGLQGKRPKRYFPFAEGPRNCVGQSLAKVSLVATAATLLSSLTFRLADQMGGPEGVLKREQYTLVTGIDGGMWLHAISRPGVEAKAKTLLTATA